MDYIVFDLEATCISDEQKAEYKVKNKQFKSEIIEIGAVKLNENLETIDTFQAFIKPILDKTLTDFCKDLTSISQEDIDKAKTFPIVLVDFLKWVGNDFYLCSWGNYDKNQFANDCELHRLKTEWLKKHISIKHQYMKLYNVSGREAGMSNVLKKFGLKLDGTHHRGIDDAKNISKIFVKIFDQLKFEV